VKPTRSANKTVTIFLSARAARVASVSAIPHSEQNFAAGAFSWPQFGQTLTAEAYGARGQVVGSGGFSLAARSLTLIRVRPSRFLIPALGAALLAILALPAGATTDAARSSPLVGRWERVTTCKELVSALTTAGLRKTAPAMLAGNGFVPGTPKQLAAKTNICKGAVPRRHSHFFTAAGQFGSVDYNGQQVDDGSYRLLDARTVRISDGKFHFRIAGRELRLQPVISAAARRKALAQPLQFSTAGWQVAMAFPGHAWKRVPCAQWC
jgi:hypothetical protein